MGGKNERKVFSSKSDEDALIVYKNYKKQWRPNNFNIHLERIDVPPQPEIVEFIK